MATEKQRVRTKFREAVLRRARLRCQGPGCTYRATPKTAEGLDAHHILDRSTWGVGGGSVLENGICLCKPCHRKAESLHETGEAFPGFSPDDLFAIIGSSPEKAREANARAVRRSRS